MKFFIILLVAAVSLVFGGCTPGLGFSHRETLVIYQQRPITHLTTYRVNRDVYTIENDSYGREVSHTVGRAGPQPAGVYEFKANGFDSQGRPVHIEGYGQSSGISGSAGAYYQSAPPMYGPNR